MCLSSAIIAIGIETIGFNQTALNPQRSGWDDWERWISFAHDYQLCSGDTGTQKDLFTRTYWLVNAAAIWYNTPISLAAYCYVFPEVRDLNSIVIEYFVQHCISRAAS